MESEIAELESFIDSYVGEDEAIQSEIFTNSSEKGNLDDFYDKDFEEELKERQKHQDFIWSDASFQYGMNGLTESIDFKPDIYAQPANYTDNSVSPVPSQVCYNQNPWFALHDQGAAFDLPTYSDSIYPPSPYFNSLEMPPVQFEGKAATSSGVGRRNYIAENDLRHRLNIKKQGNSETSERKEVGSRKKKASSSSRGRYGKECSKSDHSIINGRTRPSNSNTYNKDTYQQKDCEIEHSRHNSHSSSSESAGCSKSGIVSDRSKSEVASWLHQHSKSSKQSVERQLKNLKISKNSDLLKLVKSANSYITSEEKMKEVAVMISSKAMRNPLTAESGALLCNELSHRMVNGTSFRTVLLNIVQGHFKNRHQLIKNAIENDEDNEWCGFVNFLIQLFLNLRTHSNERLKALINPVYDCLFLILEEKLLDYKLSKCFLDNFKIAGLSLNDSNPDKMSQLMSVLRDNCVLLSHLPVEARRNLLQCLEYYARGWTSHALDASYYNTFICK